MLVRDVWVKIAPISELEEWLRGTLSMCLKKVGLKDSDSTYVQARLSYNQFGCLAEEFCFGLFNGYFQKIEVANNQLKNDISSL